MHEFLSRHGQPEDPILAPLQSVQAGARHRKAQLAADPNGEFDVTWLGISPDVVGNLKLVVDGAVDERPVQKFLEENPEILARLLSGGHGRWVIPQKRLAGRYVPDFVVAERSSIGFEWQVIELESPTAPLFTKGSRPSRQLDKGIQQIQDWRRWIADNQDMARRPRSDHGEGLTDIDGQVPGVVIIGREGSRTEEVRGRLRQLARQFQIQIRSYDWLIRMSGHAADLPPYRRSEIDVEL